MHYIPAYPLRQFTTQVLEAAGAPSSEASIVADHLVEANLLGFDSHGVIRIPPYLEWVRNGTLHPGAPITVVRETDSTAVLDCGWNFGQVGGLRAMELAIAKARKCHLAGVGTNRCGHSGRLGTYTQMAASQGLIGLAYCNSWRGGHFMLPWGGTQGRLATNPLSYAVPSDDGEPIISDFSTAATAEGMIRLYRNQGKELPAGWIVDARGNPSRDPDDFYGPPRGAILPLGGDKGYRGFALGFLVELFSGILTGSNRLAQQDGNGLFFLVVDAGAFQDVDDFRNLIRETRDYIKSSPPQNGSEVLMPGERDFRIRRERAEQGIPVDDGTWSSILEAAQTVGVTWQPTQAEEVRR